MRTSNSNALHRIPVLNIYCTLPIWL